MKIKLIISILLLCLLASCSSPRDYFNTCALNANGLAQFGSSELHNMYVTKSIIYDKATGKYRDASTFAEQYQYNFMHNEEVLEQINQLKETSDTKPLLDASKKLFGFVINVYHKEYIHIAQLRDQHAPPEVIEHAIQAIDQQYHQAFQEQYETLVKIGLDFAQKHNIKVSTFKL